MNSNRLFRALPMAAAVATLGLGATGDANAYAYAVSDLHLTDGTVTFLAPGISSLTGFGACLALSCVNPSSVTVADTQSAGARVGDVGLNSNGTVIWDAESVFPDATNPVDNTFIKEGPSNAVIYAWADSQIKTTQTLAPGTNAVNPDGSPNFATKIDVRTFGEANSNNSTETRSESNVSSQTTLTFTLGGVGGRVRFDFVVDFYRFAEITDPHNGLKANATGSVQLTINKADCIVNCTVFDWQAGGDPTLGASVFSNAFALNAATVDNVQGFDGPFNNTGGAFLGVTNDLAAGTYRMILSVKSEAIAQAEDVRVPEPATLGLLGLGLGILGFSGLRRRKS